jgi:pSer/pThr/pTyr-binding forkhead associated (FHA) protein
LFPGAWVIQLQKREGAALDARIVVGRSQGCDVWIDDTSVSKEHCYFQRSGDAYQIADANSTNGTFINGNPLAPHMLLTLRSGDKVSVGENIHFHFFYPSGLYEMLFRKKEQDKKKS